jgi:predicted RecB family nuclease
MQYVDKDIRFSASDLVGHLDCHHLTALGAAVARGAATKPKIWDPVLETLAERGRAHERQYLEKLKESGLSVVEIEGGGISDPLVARTLEAMRSGAAVIYQAAFLQGVWSGRADILRRVEVASDLGAWSYEVIDAKLARETKGATVLQLSLYSELLAVAQGRVPEHMYVVTPGTGFEPEIYRVAEFAAYYRRVKKGLEQFMEEGGGQTATYPEPNPHCELCAWRVPCDQRRRDDDHLCLVAGITKIQTNELRGHEVSTLATLANVPLPLAWKPERGSAASYERVREQARIQFDGRVAGKPLYEILAVEKDLGLSRLPVPSPGDVFFDLEGDPFVEDGGLEYLFGYAFEEGLQYVGDWAVSRADEKRVFETFVDFAMARWKDYPDFHIYHYAPYEPSALKRLMGRYASRQEEIDRMLHGQVFVDLLQVVRQGIRASVESYSIKEMEKFFGFNRGTPLKDASRALANIQTALEIGDPEAVTAELKETVTGYNKDDCFSAKALRDWLETIRADLVAKGTVIDRPAPAESETSDDRKEWQKRVDDVVERLTAGIPADVRERTAEQQARWILAHTLDWHGREVKTVWWEYFRLSDLSAEDLLDERASVSGLTMVGAVGGTKKSPVHRYQFPSQETEFRGGEDLHSAGGEKFGSVESISLEQRTIDIKKRMDCADLHPEGVFAHKVIGTKEQAESLMRIGENIADYGFDGSDRYRAARDLLLRHPPRLGTEPMYREGESPSDTAKRIALHLKGGVLPIQGPPGTGKTHVGARMIATLVKAGKRVGITANSHTVIRRLLDEVVEAAVEVGVSLKCIQKTDKGDATDCISLAKKNADVFDALHGNAQVAAGTAWLWSVPDAQNSVDVLFVDEAAQMSLANVLAVSQAAPNLVLLGDPRQLDQPTQGTHPEGTGVSALDYILDGHQTIPSDRGLFLAETWRLHPAICAFTSEVFYENRLVPIPGLDLQEIRSKGRISGSGLRFVPVEHQGNQNSSPEEAEVIRQLVADILESATSWVDRKGVEKAVGLEDILIIAPYNAQVFDLKDKIPGAKIGTVDKFQGQEAPIVIYSMTTSTHADAPRGMGFLYSLNRLNVATSRAKCLSTLVCSPQLFEPECRTPEQIRMANAFCRYLEMATAL